MRIHLNCPIYLAASICMVAIFSLLNPLATIAQPAASKEPAREIRLMEGSVTGSGRFDCSGSKAKASAPKLSGWVKELEHKFAQVGSIEGDFSQESYLSSLDLSEASSGELFFSKPGEMRWNYQSPESQVFVIRDETMWYYQPNDRQVVIDRFSKHLLSDVPVGFLMGVSDLSTNFLVQDGCEKEWDGKPVRIISLVPRSKQSKESKGGGEGTLSSVELALLSSSSSQLPLYGIKVNDSLGNVTSLTLANLKTNSGKLDAALFELEFPAGTDVSDRRNG